MGRVFIFSVLIGIIFQGNLFGQKDYTFCWDVISLTLYDGGPAKQNWYGENGTKYIKALYDSKGKLTKKKESGIFDLSSGKKISKYKE